ncbi:MAG TPA: carbohydrate kinase family protein [Candidatus Limnocylindrales bacterium]|nr:carbohydrate kinase family protein [Candidatus Limnocylindrales bacterium]
MTSEDPAGSETLLLGALSLDRYLPDGPVLPGGGALNVAWHWRSLGLPFTLITRVGDGEAALFLDMLERHGIDHVPGSIVAAGPSASIDIEFLPDRQPWMDNYVQGVCGDLRFTLDEVGLLGEARRLHAILVEGVIAELERQGEAGRLAHLEVVADFLGFRHYTVDRFAATMRWVDLAIVGWPGQPGDATVAALRDVVRDLGKRLVVTFGSQGVLVVDGAAGSERSVAVTPSPVAGTTIGCGDAFIAYLLADWWRNGDLSAAVELGKIGGALPTAWVRPLPDAAYGGLLQPA